MAKLFYFFCIIFQLGPPAILGLSIEKFVIEGNQMDKMLTLTRQISVIMSCSTMYLINDEGMKGPDDQRRVIMMVLVTGDTAFHCARFAIVQTLVHPSLNRKFNIKCNLSKLQSIYPLRLPIQWYSPCKKLKDRKQTFWKIQYRSYKKLQ